FDTGPANVLMDGWMQTQLHQTMDQHGQLAQQGQVNDALFDKLMQHPYLSLPPPKSTGRETFNQSFLKGILDSLDSIPSHADILRTLLEFTTHSIALAILNLGQQGRLIACGGGSYNPMLMQHLQALLPSFVVETSSTHGIEPQWMEAMAFAWLAWARLHHEPGNVPSVTGAQGLRCLGGLYVPTAS
ncbi:MAG: anhydro-N-acetylmuramic acid kinase, partial [Pseudomonadales bacterium]|nr:anhydro-N-acetylmuramic acid kinase [Pseudomonadales bacterium]